LTKNWILVAVAVVTSLVGLGMTFFDTHSPAYFFYSRWCIGHGRECDFDTKLRTFSQFQGDCIMKTLCAVTNVLFPVRGYPLAHVLRCLRRSDKLDSCLSIVRLTFLWTDSQD
jgi:hypothetical protein